MKNCEFRFFRDDGELARSAAGAWLELVPKGPKPCFVALSGGRIAPVFYAAIVEESRRMAVSLGQTHFFWADERCVAPDDPESNFRLANEQLFQPLAIALSRIHRIRGELPGAKAESEANAEIRRVAPINSDGVPMFDMIFLGIGPDGHTASLMPNAPPEVEDATDPYVYVSNSPKPPLERITLTYPVMAAARNVWALIAGKDKEQALRESLKTGARTPFGRVLESRKETKIFSSVALS